MSNRLNFEKSHSDDLPAYVPTKKTSHSAGIDLMTSYETTVMPGTKAMIRTSLRVSFPTKTFGLITGKSSMAYSGLWVHNGVIDEDYTGELIVLVYNTNPNPVTIEKGQAVAQLLVLPYNNDLYTITTGGETKLVSNRDSAGFGVTNTQTLVEIAPGDVPKCPKEKRTTF